MSNVSFDVRRDEFKLINAIASRAVAYCNNAGIDYDIATALMDVTATHCNGCRLRLRELLEANDFNFAHDILGIRRHINRETGELAPVFSPRYSA